MVHGVQAVAPPWPAEALHPAAGGRLTTADLDDLARRMTPDDKTARYRLVSKASYARRKAAANGSGAAALSAAESERVTRIAHLWNFAVEVMGREDKARGFLSRPNMLLRGQSPLDVALASESGGRRVEELLGGLAYGTAV